MSTSYQVETHDPVITEMLLNLARKYNWSIRKTIPVEQQPIHLILFPDREGRVQVDWNSKFCANHKALTLVDAIKLLRKGPGPEPITINGSIVEFKLDGIQVGCMFVATSVVDEIHSRLHSKT